MTEINLLSIGLVHLFNVFKADIKMKKQNSGIRIWRFKVLVAVATQTKVFWDVMPCSLAHGFRRNLLLPSRDSALGMKTLGFHETLVSFYKLYGVALHKTVIFKLILLYDNNLKIQFTIPTGLLHRILRTVEVHSRHTDKIIKETIPVRCW
jgi:hypothetical protein